MQMQHLPCLFYFPLKIIIVDDNEDYLTLYKSKINLNQVTTSTQPLDIIDKLETLDIKIQSFIKEWIINEFCIDYSAITNFVHQYNFLDKVGILIADYKMPKINGVDLCAKFEHTNLLKILLTGEYQIEDAVEALNNKQIDYYIAKSLDNKLTTVIENLQVKFFNRITDNICQMINSKDLLFIKDNNFSKIFNDVIQSNSISTYFVLNNYGAYYLENQTNKFILSIYSKIDLDELNREYPTLLVKNDTDKMEQTIPSARSLLTNNIEFLQCSYSNNYYYNLEDVTDINLPWHI